MAWRAEHQLLNNLAFRKVAYVENPLTKKDLSDIKDALYKLNDLGSVLDLLDKLGQETNEMRERAQFLQNVLTTLRTELFPDKP